MTVTVNNKALSSDISLAASDVGAVPVARKVNNKVLSADITLTASDVGALSSSGGTVSGSINITGDLKKAGKDVLTTDNLIQDAEYIYPNGTAASPVTVTKNNEIVLNDPYAGKSVNYIPQISILGGDGVTRWIDVIYTYENGNNWGVNVATTSDGKILIVCGGSALVGSSQVTSGLPASYRPSGAVASAKLRLRVIK